MRTILACAASLLAASSTVHARSQPEASGIASATLHEHYSNFQIVEFCERSGIKTRSRSTDADIVDGMRRLEVLSGFEQDRLDRNWSETRERTMEAILSEPEHQIEQLCAFASDRLAHIGSIAEMLENYHVNPLGDVSPSEARPF